MRAALRQGKAHGTSVGPDGVDSPHCGHESHCAPHPYRGECPHGVKATALEQGERHRVAQRHRWYEKQFRQGEKCKNHSEPRVGMRVAVVPCEHHHHRSHGMTQPQKPLGGDKPVGHGAHQCGRKQGGKATCGVKPRYARAKPCRTKILP